MSNKLTDQWLMEVTALALAIERRGLLAQTDNRLGKRGSVDAWLTLQDQDILRLLDLLRAENSKSNAKLRDIA